MAAWDPLRRPREIPHNLSEMQRETWHLTKHCRTIPYISRRARLGPPAKRIAWQQHGVNAHAASTAAGRFAVARPMIELRSHVFAASSCAAGNLGMPERGNEWRPDAWLLIPSRRCLNMLWPFAHERRRELLLLIDAPSRPASTGIRPAVASNGGGSQPGHEFENGRAVCSQCDAWIRRVEAVPQTSGEASLFVLGPSPHRRRGVLSRQTGPAHSSSGEIAVRTWAARSAAGMPSAAASVGSGDPFITRRAACCRA